LATLVLSVIKVKPLLSALLVIVQVSLTFLPLPSETRDLLSLSEVTAFLI